MKIKIMLKKSLFILSIIAALAFSAVAQKVYTPEKGTAERTAVLSALRVPVERDLKQKVQFDITTFRIQGNWAFINGAPQNMTGGEPDYSKTKYADAVSEGIFDNNFQALLRKTGGKWKVTTYAIGCTDVCWLDWTEKFKAPKAIFPAFE